MIKNIIIIILILAFLGVIIFLDVPKVQSIFSLRDDIEQKKEEFDKEQEMLNRVNKLIELYDENKESIDRLEYILPVEKDIPNLIVQLEALAVESGLFLDSIDFFAQDKKARSRAERIRSGAEDNKVENYNTLNISLAAMGSYSALKFFMENVEKNIRIMDIQSINFSSASSGDSDVGLFNFEIKIETYYQ
ncbi:MAG: type 4a pilus biogenesis protein PilO [Candidatus Portnoybacteria bacterium]|nr:type 4a pilus biogenesis protein PilO [Candidatus Portnoybacteria bacterium]